MFKIEMCTKEKHSLSMIY